MGCTSNEYLQLRFLWRNEQNYLSFMKNRPLSFFKSFESEPHCEKTNILVSDLVRHKPDCTATEDGLKFRIQKVEGLYYLCSEKKGADQLRGSGSLFSHMQNVFVFS